MSSPDTERGVESGPTLARHVAERLARFRVYLMTRVQEVNEMTAREVMAAVTTLASVVECASAHVQNVKRVLTATEGSEGRIRDAIASQSQALKLLLESVTIGVARREAVAERAQEHWQMIAKASSDTAQLAGSADLLAVNARAEAVRVGGSGDSFSALAEGMQQLAAQISQTSLFIEGLARRLSQDLSEVAVSTRDLSALRDGLSGEVSSTAEQVSREVDGLRDAMRACLADSDAQLEQITSASQNALSHLQFQDVVSQGLCRLEGGLVELQRFYAETHGLDVEISDPKHSEIGGEKAVVQENAGEVLLF